MKKIGERSERTRERVLALLAERGTATAVELSAELCLTPAGIRRHLAALEASGEITTLPDTGPHTHRGRPARSYVVVRDQRASAEIAVAALTQLYRLGGHTALDDLAHTVAGVVQERLRNTLVSVEENGAHPSVHAVASALTREGYNAEVDLTEGGAVLCQHHCPVQTIAEALPQLCEAETHALEELLGREVERHTTIARGDSACITHIPVKRHAEGAETS